MMTQRVGLRIAAALLLAAGVTTTAAAQTPLTLADALRLATDHSEAVAIARAAESHAEADTTRAASEKLPQVNASASYSRTLASEFSRALDDTGPVCAPFAPDPSKPLADRVAEIERAAGCGSLGPSFSFADLPFGQRNIYQFGLTFAQAIYAGGRITAQQRQADAARRTAALATSTAEAQVKLDVTRAFYDAALADRLVTIAESTYDQAAAAYEQVRLAFDAGRQPEFELLRAQVARDNQRPTVIRRRADRDIAYLHLRQLLELPATAPLTLDVDLETPMLPPPAPYVDALAATPSIDDHLIVQQAAFGVAAREAAVTIARAERLPSVSVTSTYGRVGYPSDGVFPGVGDFRTNWSLAATAQLAVFTGGRLRADEAAARADLSQASAQMKQTRELAELDEATARQDLRAAEAVWEASAGTVQQAERAYQIAELRNREGLSTQLELSDSRLSLEVARATRAQAARDLQVARARLALTPALPAGAR
ncbi:MAG TPA: TolC family protein [Vicinamibacterales bacterium]|jgi:outer membrane protein TolC|nr:TolC family protein [Vicinamibacterales bacterium]